MAHRGKLSYRRYEEIKQEILFMFEETETDTFPIDCFEIARRLNYVLRPYSTLTFVERLKAFGTSSEGYSTVEVNPITGMNYYVIYYNDEAHSPGNIRWTIFHEIGHIYLGHHDNPPGNEQQEEDEANFFAKYAMCPPPLLNATHCHCSQDVLVKFNTSNQFAGYAFDYFQKWLRSGPKDYMPYEIEMLKLFHFLAA